MLSRALGTVVAALLLPLLVVAPRAAADGRLDVPSRERIPSASGPGSSASLSPIPVNRQPGRSRRPRRSRRAAARSPVGCHKSDGTEVPCQTTTATGGRATSATPLPYDAPPGTPGLAGPHRRIVVAVHELHVCRHRDDLQRPDHLDGTWPRARAAHSRAACVPRLSDLLPLATADIHTAPEPPAATYIGVENWLWLPDGQWATLPKSVTAGATTVTVTAAPSQIVWNLGPTSITCYDPGTPWVQGMTDAASDDLRLHLPGDLGQSSHKGSSQITATIRYHVTWSCTGTCPTTGGDLGLVDAPAGASTMRVLQRQTVVVQ